MKPLLQLSQKYAVAVFVVIVMAVLAGVSGEGFLGKIDQAFGLVVSLMVSVLFVSLPDAIAGIWWFMKQMPLVVLVLVGGAVYFTFYFGFINLRAFGHAIQVVRGKYDNPDDPGEVSHFQALSSALSATVGLGNIAGVAIAVSIGGPGAVFWMVVAALFGMTSKFAECTLGLMYRQVDPNGVVRGGPMVYLRDGLRDIGRPQLGKLLSVVFAVMCIGGSFGGGNMFQANQSFQAIAKVVPWLGGDQAKGQVKLTADQPRDLDLPQHLVRFETTGTSALIYTPQTERVTLKPADWKADPAGGFTAEVPVVATRSGPQYDAATGAISVMQVAKVDGRKVTWAPLEGVKAANPQPLAGGVHHRGWLYGLILAVLVGLVIVGGIKSIGRVADKIVPFMAILYVGAGLFIVLSNFSLIPHAVGVIISEAFNPAAGAGGIIGVIIQGVRRAAFSNEAGIGSASIAHSAAKTDEPVREGLVALLEPFIDTVVICFMTGIVIVITGVYADPATAGLDGVLLTAAAFKTVAGWFPIILTLAVVLFAYSTMISWSYYGERCWTFLFGEGQSMTYRLIFLFFVWLGCVSSLSNVLDFSDLMILSMAFPNILGVVMLSPKILEALDSYWTRFKQGKFKIYHE